MIGFQRLGLQTLPLDCFKPALKFHFPAGLFFLSRFTAAYNMPPPSWLNLFFLRWGFLYIGIEKIIDCDIIEWSKDTSVATGNNRRVTEKNFQDRPFVAELLNRLG